MALISISYENVCSPFDHLTIYSSPKISDGHLTTTQYTLDHLTILIIFIILGTQFYRPKTT
jgi:hypothetical protein